MRAHLHAVHAACRLPPPRGHQAHSHSSPPHFSARLSYPGTAFHTSWFGFFASFYSTFAAASLSPYIIPDLNLTNVEWAQSGIAAVCGTIFFRLAMGWICEVFGPRKGLGYLLLSITPAIVIMMFVQNAWQFIMMRCIIGFSLATFVACQTWCSQMFAKNVVGGANATAAGWGNLGGGVTNLTMPLVFLVVSSFVDNNESLAWRLSYFVPLALHIIAGLLVLTSRDLPDGNYAELELSGAKQKAKSNVVLAVGFSNINAWILTLTYGMCFGIELTMNNVAARYFYAYQGLTPQLAGLAASCWGLMNLFARSCGGFLSDWSNKKAGIRGRLWSCWLVQTIEGVFCILLGMVTINYDAPDTDLNAVKTNAWVNIPKDPLRSAVGFPEGWVDFNATCFDHVDPADRGDLLVPVCGTAVLRTTSAIRDCLKIGSNPPTILRQTAPLADGGPDMDCISNSGTVGLVMLLVVFFSLCVQAAEGLHYGIVPYVSRPALGVVSGMVGAGGNTGAVIAGNLFFQGTMRTDQGIIGMGVMIIVVTGLLFLVYFPEPEKSGGGSMLFPVGFLGSYDPQIIKPPDGYEGADKMDYAAAAANIAAQKSGTSTTESQVKVVTGSSA